MRADVLSTLDLAHKDLEDELNKHGLSLKHLYRQDNMWVGGCFRLDAQQKLGSYVTAASAATIAELILSLVAAAAASPVLPIIAAGASRALLQRRIYGATGSAPSIRHPEPIPGLTLDLD